MDKHSEVKLTGLTAAQVGRIEDYITSMSESADSALIAVIEGARIGKTVASMSLEMAYDCRDYIRSTYDDAVMLATQDCETDEQIAFAEKQAGRSVDLTVAKIEKAIDKAERVIRKEQDEQAAEQEKVARAKRNNRFAKGSGVYTCTSCGKRTRETGEGESKLDLCVDCYEEAGLENEHEDGHHDGNAHDDCPLCTHEDIFERECREAEKREHGEKCTECGAVITNPGSTDTPGSLCFACQETAELEMMHDTGEHDDNPHPECKACSLPKKTEADHLRTLDTSEEAIVRRTDVFLERCRDKRYEWETLFTVVCLGHGWEPEEALALYALLDMDRVTKRIDELKREMLAELDNEHQQQKE